MYDLAASPKELKALESEHDYRLHSQVIIEINETIGKFLEHYEAV